MGKIKPGDLVTINLAGTNTDVYIFWPYPYNHSIPEFHPKIYYYRFSDPPMLYLGPAKQLITNPDSSNLRPHKFLHQGKVIFTQIRETQALEDVFEKAKLE